MKVRMTVNVSGTRDGKDWPRMGSVMEMADVEALEYIRSGMATPVTVAREERAVIDVSEVETRAEAPAVEEVPAPRPEPARRDVPRGPNRR